MQERVREANRALLNGDRSCVVELLKQRTTSVEEMWLLANAVEDEHERLNLLNQVASAGKPPYSQMAAKIIEREEKFEAQIQEAPGYQTWLLENMNRLIALIITIIVLSGTFLIALQFIFPPDVSPLMQEATSAAAATQQAIGATETIIALTPTNTLTPTITFTPSLTPTPTYIPTNTAVPKGIQMSYSPIGKIKVLDYQSGFQNVTELGRDDLKTPPEGFHFAALHYQFICDDAQISCDDPITYGEFIALELEDGKLIEYKRLTELGAPTPAPVAPGHSVEGRLVFQVPNSVEPQFLVIQLDLDGDRSPETYRASLR